RRKIGPAILEALGNYANHAGVSMLTACGHVGLGEHLNEGQLDKLREFAQWLERKRELIERGGGVQLIHELIDDIAYEDWLRQQCSTPAAAERAIANVMTLTSALEKSIAKAKANDEDEDLEAAINKLILRDM